MKHVTAPLMWLRRPLTVGVSLAGLAGSALPAASQEPGTSEKPRLRAEYFYGQRAYPFARVPAGALQRALRDYQRRWPEMAAARKPLTAVAQPLSTTSWTALGPAPIANRDAGRISTVAIHPARPELLFIGAAQGGVWRSADGGEQWEPLTDGECSLAMGSIALDPVNPDIVYAGTGELHFSGDSYYGCGLLRSTDGGATWTQLGANTFDTNSGGARVSKVIVDASTAGSTTSTTVFMASNFGVHRSTDAGVSWTRVLEGIATDMVVHPNDPRMLYVSIGSPNVSAANGVYKSTDGGTTWVRLSGGFPTADVGRISLAIAESDPDVLYAAVQNAFDSPRAPGDGQLLGIWKTTDGGSVWIKLPATNASCGTQCWYDLVIAVHPTDPDRVYFGGVFIYRSVNGGNSFLNVSNGIHVDHHAIAFDPRNPTIMYSGNDGGIYRSTNGGSSWRSINGNLQITQFYAGIALHPTDAGIVLGGTQDNGTLESGGSPAWNHVLGGDGGFTAIDFQDPNIAWAETQWTPNSSFSGPRRRDGPGQFGVRMIAGIDLSDGALFIPPLVMDAIDPSVLYFGTFRLYRTRNRGELWTPISGSLTRNAGGRISAIAPAPSDPATVYVGSNDGVVHVTTDGGNTWTLRSTGLPNRFITDLAVDAADARKAIATVSGFGTGHVFRTVDGGSSWQDISTNLPDVPVNAVTLHPTLGPDIYLGTDLGMFRSTDGGLSWSPFNENFPNVAVFDIAYSVSSGMLVAATHGRGTFGLMPLVAATLTLSTDSVTFTSLGDSVRLQVIATTAAGDSLPDVTPIWNSSDEQTATVDAMGLVRAAGNGTARIVARLAGRADTAHVRVQQVLAAVTGLADSASLVVGETSQLAAAGVDARGHTVADARITWSSSDPSVAAVDATGELLALTPGSATVAALAGAFRDTSVIRVGPPAIVALDAAALPGSTSASSAAGTRLPLLRVRLRVDGIEAVRITRLGFEATGEDVGASLMLVHDVDADGAIGPSDVEIGTGSAPLRRGETTQVMIEPGGLDVPAAGELNALVALRLSGAAPNGTAFSVRYLPEHTRSIGSRSGQQDRITQPGTPVASAVIRTTVLPEGQRLSMSENPVRSGGVTFNFPTRPSVAGIYTLNGRLVADLAARMSGNASAHWDLTNASGASVGPGVFLLVFQIDGVVVREKLIVLRASDPDS